MYEIIAQIVGYMALAFFVGSFWFKKRSIMLTFLAIECFLFGIHYIMIDGITGGVLDLIAGVLSVLYIFKDKNKFFSSIWIPIVFFVLYIIATILTYESWISLIPCASLIISGIILWQKETKQIRLLSLIYVAMWILYSALIGSIPGVISDSIAFLSVCGAIYTLDIKKSSKKLK